MESINSQNQNTQVKNLEIDAMGQQVIVMKNPGLAAVESFYFQDSAKFIMAKLRRDFCSFSSS